MITVLRTIVPENGRGSGVSERERPAHESLVRAS